VRTQEKRTSELFTGVNGRDDDGHVFGRNVGRMGGKRDGSIRHAGNESDGIPKVAIESEVLARVIQAQSSSHPMIPNGTTEMSARHSGGNL
jgi:hypothetical protein